MTRRAVEGYLVHLSPRPAVSPGVRKRPAPAPTRQQAQAGSAEPCQPDLYNIRLVEDEGLMAKLDRAAEVSGMGDTFHNMGEIFERALDEYRSSEGLRCSEWSRLMIDHIESWGLGGTSEERNLRVLCFAHNRLHVDRCFGPSSWRRSSRFDPGRHKTG
jgi:hypothetical protein